MFNLKDKLLEEYGEDITQKIIDGYEAKRCVTLRVNTSLTNNDYIEQILKNNNIQFEKVELLLNAYIIKNKTEEDIKKLDIYNNGYIYLQSLSSQIPPIFMDLHDNEQILDMAAAPGGKTTEMANIAKVMITACEKNKIRCERLKYNIDKQNAKRINVMQKDARDLDDFFTFDKILLDAPCSGSGTLDKCELDEDLINRSVTFQKELLSKAIKLVKKDGLIVYSTCSILKEENEDIIKEHLGKDLELIPIDTTIYDLPLLPTTLNGVLCLYPNELYEGFFISILKKK